MVCASPGCRNGCSYGREEDGIALFCYDHRDKNMHVNVRRKGSSSGGSGLTMSDRCREYNRELFQRGSGLVSDDNLDTNCEVLWNKVWPELATPDFPLGMTLEQASNSGLWVLYIGMGMDSTAHALNKHTVVSCLSSCMYALKTF